MFITMYYNPRHIIILLLFFSFLFKKIKFSTFVFNATLPLRCLPKPSCDLGMCFAVDSTISFIISLKLSERDIQVFPVAVSLSFYCFDFDNKRIDGAIS